MQAAHCVSHQPPSQACKEFSSSLYILYQESLSCSSMFLSSIIFPRYLEIHGMNSLLTKCFIIDQHFHQILRGGNVSEYLFLSLQYLRMCLRYQLRQKFLPNLSYVCRNLQQKQLPPFWKEQYWLVGNLSASLRTKASPKQQNKLSVSVLGQSEPSCCHSGSQQPKAEQTPHLSALQWAEGEVLVQPEPIIFAIAAALPSA